MSGIPQFSQMADEAIWASIGEVGVDYTPINLTSSAVLQSIEGYMREARSQDEGDAVSHYTHCIGSSGVAMFGNVVAINCEGCAMATPRNEEIEVVRYYRTSDGVRVVVREHHCSGLVCAGVCTAFQHMVEEVQ